VVALWWAHRPTLLSWREEEVVEALAHTPLWSMRVPLLRETMQLFMLPTSRVQAGLMEAEGSQGQEKLLRVAEAEEDFLRPVGRYRITMVTLLLWEAPVI
jgi:hypothetical protein